MSRQPLAAQWRPKLGLKRHLVRATCSHEVSPVYGNIHEEGAGRLREGRIRESMLKERFKTQTGLWRQISVCLVVSNDCPTRIPLKAQGLKTSIINSRN